MRRTVDNVPDQIDGHDNPAQRFGDVYKDLYNSTNDTAETKDLLAEINAGISENDLKDIDLVTNDVIADAIN